MYHLYFLPVIFIDNIFHFFQKLFNYQIMIVVPLVIAHAVVIFISVLWDGYFLDFPFICLAFLVSDLLINLFWCQIRLLAISLFIHILSQFLFIFMLFIYYVLCFLFLHYWFCFLLILLACSMCLAAILYWLLLIF